MNLGVSQPVPTHKCRMQCPEYATIRNELQIYDNLPVGEWQGTLQALIQTVLIKDR